MIHGHMNVKKKTISDTEHLRTYAEKHYYVPFSVGTIP